MQTASGWTATPLLDSCGCYGAIQYLWSGPSNWLHLGRNGNFETSTATIQKMKASGNQCRPLRIPTKIAHNPNPSFSARAHCFSIVTRWHCRVQEVGLPVFFVAPCDLDVFGFGFLFCLRVKIRVSVVSRV